MRGKSARWNGPGLIMAASGIGASDIIASADAGAGYGLALLCFRSRRESERQRDGPLFTYTNSRLRMERVLRACS